MTDRLLHAFHRLPETQESQAFTDHRFLYMGGEGGTGKSRIVRTIVNGFDQMQCRSRLNISATTGVAANIIGGSPIDSLYKLEWIDSSPVRLDSPEPTVSFPLQISRPVTRWTRCQFLILDEVCRHIYSISNISGLYAGRSQTPTNLAKTLSFQNLSSFFRRPRRLIQCRL
jgi:hypothetical protein